VVQYLKGQIGVAVRLTALRELRWTSSERAIAHYCLFATRHWWRTNLLINKP